MKNWTQKGQNRLVIAALCLLCSSSCAAVISGDAYVRTEGSTWIFGTRSVEETVALENGILFTVGFRNKTSGRELVAPRVFPLTSAGPWQLIETKGEKLGQGELQLDLTLKHNSLVVTKTYVVYPGSSIIREWTVFKNVGTTPLKITEPEFFAVGFGLGGSDSLEFHWMTGGENQPGSWVLRTEKLSVDQPRTFDSYDPFPRSVQTCAGFPGDILNATILLNGAQVWPAQDWHYLPVTAGAPVPFDVSIPIESGDKLAFVTSTNTETNGGVTAFDPKIVFEDGESHSASKEFFNEQGRNGWQYQVMENGHFVDLVYDAATHLWSKEQGSSGDTSFASLFVAQDDQQGNYMNQAAARVWTSTRSGKVRITGSVCDTGSQDKAGFHAGSSSYAPWVAFADTNTKDGLFIGWDYFGHWASSYRLAPDGSVAARLRVTNYNQMLAPGQSVTAPKAFVGLFRGDLDNAGNELLDWQYRYMWDYTREGWFPAIRVTNGWVIGSCFPEWVLGKTACKPDYESAFRSIFRFADLMHYVGADVYHRDAGWWNLREGDWKSPDFRTAGQYLRKHGMGQLIYAVLYNVDPQSQTAREHPDWVLGAGTLDMSRPEVVEFLKNQLGTFVERWGDFEWRNDGLITSARNGDDTPILGQDQGMRRILQSFLDEHPQSAFQAVNGGGNYAGGPDYTRYASSVSLSDGAVGIIRNYWASLFMPPDKTSDIPSMWKSNRYDKALWRGLLSMNFDMLGDTWDPSNLEGLRELIDIYHYLESKGVVGRWVHVYRPIVIGDDPTMYFERLSKDGKRGVIIPKRPAPGPVAIRPKGLLPKESYVISYHESRGSETRTGADLIRNGIVLPKMPPGELIYLNLPMHPGSKLDITPPTPPSAVIKRRNNNMGYPGIELEWTPGTDNNWISYYEIFRNRVAIDKVAKGTFYFDHSAGADLAAAYEVRTVDGAGNPSPTAAAHGPAAEPSRIIDDAPGGGITFSPQWRHATETPLVAYNGTITFSNEKGATAELGFEGKRVLWFTKLGPGNGIAAVSIDGGPSERVDTYSADDIWGVCVFRREFPTVGRHTIRIEVLGDRNMHSSEQTTKDAFIYVDAIRAEMK
jgi:hypothetical protein